MEFQLFPTHCKPLSLNPNFTRKRKLSFSSYGEIDRVDEVNLGLGLGLGFEHSWKIKKEKSDMVIDTSEKRIMEEKLESFRFYSKQDQLEEANLGISTKLRILEDPWKIKKLLTVSDTNGLSRLMVSAHLIRSQVLPFMENDMVEKIESGVGARVNVVDYDCRCLYQLTLKRWEKNRCYIFNNNWTATIVNGRGLKVGDEIGLFWDRIDCRFGFRVLTWGARGGSRFCDRSGFKNQ